MLKIKHLKPILTLAFVAVAALVVAACQPDDPNADLPKGAIRLAAEGFRPADGTKLGVDDRGAQVYFTEGDEIWINGKKFTVSTTSGGTAYITLPDDETDPSYVSAPYHAIYPYSLAEGATVDYSAHTISNLTLPCPTGTHVDLRTDDGSLNGGLYTAQIDPSTGFPKVAAPLIAYQATETDELQFKHLTAALVLAVTNPTTLDIHIKSAEIYQNNSTNDGGKLVAPVSGISFVDPQVSFTASGTAQARLFVDIEDGGYTIPAGGYGYIQVPIMPVNKGQFTVTLTATHDSETDGVANFRYYYQQKQQNTRTGIKQNEIAYVGISFAADEKCLLADGLFSVSASKKIYFAKGNLKYKIRHDATSSTGDNAQHYESADYWKFQDSQDAIIEQSETTFTSSSKEYLRAGNNDPNTPKWMSLFLFGATGAKIQPRMLPNYNKRTEISNNITGDLTISDNTDWGVRARLTYPGDWYTLSEDEWNYLLETRPMKDASGADKNRYAFAIVNGTFGMIIYPDKYWTMPNTISTTGTLPDSDWKKMEKDGVVFLLATGSLKRSQNIATMQNNKYLYYWTSTKQTNFNSGRAMQGTTTNSSVTCSFEDTYYSSINPHWACAVRLVRP